MEQIIQLKTMRDEALVRLQNNPDYKLVNSLDALIQDLESVLLPTVGASSSLVSDETTSADAQSSAEENSEESIVEIETAGIDDDTSEDYSEINEQLEELAVSSQGEASSAIDALEAELSQAVTGVDDDAAKPESTIN